MEVGINPGQMEVGILLPVSPEPTLGRGAAQQAMALVFPMPAESQHSERNPNQLRPEYLTCGGGGGERLAHVTALA